MLVVSGAAAQAQGAATPPDGVALAVVTKGVCDDLLRHRAQAEKFLGDKAIEIDIAVFRTIDPGVEKAYNMLVAGHHFAVVLRGDGSCGVYAKAFREPGVAVANFQKIYLERSPGSICERQQPPVEQIRERIHCLTAVRPDGTATYVIMSTAADPQQRGFAGLTSAGTVRYEDARRAFQTNKP